MTLQKLRNNFAFISIFLCSVHILLAQPVGYWQQHVQYDMTIDFDVKTHQFEGKQKLIYTNNSPDTLHHVFYHLYFNAFQPGSMMDARSRSIEDPDPRIGDRIQALKPEEQGYHKVVALKCNGQKTEFEIEGTLMEVKLKSPILPGATATLDMEFKSQVPLQIRRSGRMSNEGIDYTMTQWYPRMAAYDYSGWNISPYISREFYGDFGSFDVHINIDSSYTIAGTGVLQNPDEIGHGYARAKPIKPLLNWHFKAENVHDFAWAADPEYRHKTSQIENGTALHFFYRKDSLSDVRWEKLIPYTQQLFRIMNDKFGEYPYPQFSVIQGGDGGMEYPMCTMITSGGSFNGLVSVTVHEAIHNWYYGVLASNESKYPWMDEGFTTYAQNIVLDSLHQKGSSNPHVRSYASYLRATGAGEMEPMTTHADFYETNGHYGVNAYSKGCVFLSQLRYIIGESAFDKGMLKYWNKWQFKHPQPVDFERIMESVSGMNLDWYFENWLGTDKTIDYAIAQVNAQRGSTEIIIENRGEIPMPLVIEVENDGKTYRYYIPQEIMRGDRNFKGNTSLKQEKDWPWTYPRYNLRIDMPLSSSAKIVIDPDGNLADIDRQNNMFPNDIPTFE